MQSPETIHKVSNYKEAPNVPLKAAHYNKDTEHFPRCLGYSRFPAAHAIDTIGRMKG